MRYVGLDSPERHIARVRSRVGLGGHDIPDAKIASATRQAVSTYGALLPRLTNVVIYDNSKERDPNRGEEPRPAPLLEMAHGRIVFVAPRERISSWARPIVAAAILSDRERRG